MAEAVRTCNVADDPNRFVIDPKEHIEQRRQARLRGLDVLGFYHSHPHSPAVPSVTDLVEASYMGHLYLIVSPGAKLAKIRVFRLEEGGFFELGFVAVPAP